MGMARIGGLKRNGMRLGLEHDVDDGREIHIAVVRAFVIAPAHVHAQLLGRDVGQRMVQGLHMHLRALAKFGKGQIGVLDVPPHGQIGAVNLQHDASLGHAFVFVTHHFGNGIQIGFVVFVMVIAEKQRHHTRRRRTHEHLLRRRFVRHLGKGSAQVVGIGVGGLAIDQGDGRIASRRFAP